MRISAEINQQVLFFVLRAFLVLEEIRLILSDHLSDLLERERERRVAGRVS